MEGIIRVLFGGHNLNDVAKALSVSGQATRLNGSDPNGTSLSRKGWARNNVPVWRSDLVRIRLKRLLLAFVLIEQNHSNSGYILRFCD